MSDLESLERVLAKYAERFTDAWGSFDVEDFKVLIYGARELQAQAAAMREVLEASVRSVGEGGVEFCHECYARPWPNHEPTCDAGRTLFSDAGKALLERLRKAEAMRESQPPQLVRRTTTVRTDKTVTEDINFSVHERRAVVTEETLDDGLHAPDLEHQLTEAKAVLREVEWRANSEFGSECPSCFGRDPAASRLVGVSTGHAPDCRLAKVLAK